jgi:hypothetical protein
MAESVRTPPYLTHQSDEKGRLEAYVVALEGQIEGQKARLAELEAALERKAEATPKAPKEEGSKTECQRRVICQRVRKLARTAGSIRQESLKVTACGRTARPGKGKSPNIVRTDNVVHQVQGHLRAKMMVVHLDGSAPYLGAARNEQP